MTSSKRVVETTPQISISSVKEYVSHRHPIIQLNLTSSHGRQTPYLVNTARTECYFGGSRPWFKCILCNKRVGVLYLNEDGNHLFCRECSNLRYRSQAVGGSNRMLMRYFDADERAEAVFEGSQKVKIWHKGNPTRRFKKFLKYRQQAERLSRLFTN
ncbi:MAG: hypothetical protein COZ34_02420 [Candidatus Pacebacteria bacterium CG_4_10_14_3_um_filter_34_15]|nr:hypothetical protein [Candidatus Paceibacterota bacterium]OIO44899.1 MAG: hypothetical protein AUJ41_01425 [Candidatus Pacebacteria bacterium CG1_02_43_31]PIX81574.1 MAG: hypothetical protein COZ34_02420 [Candidatus Pacebacteria bacterium CG_4_10_14_3_um_filter_34_15]